jgi:toxin ParE1/3/4
MQVVIAPAAVGDIANILAWTAERFGPQIVRRYGKLIATAIEQVGDNPDLPGSSSRPEIIERCRTYHLFFSRKSAGRPGDRIRRPRHFLLYRVAASGTIEIGRVLHDSMDFESHLPEDFRRLPE